MPTAACAVAGPPDVRLCPAAAAGGGGLYATRIDMDVAIDT